MTAVRTIALLVFVLIGTVSFGQEDSTGVIYGSFKLRKAKVTCIPSYLIDKVKVSDVAAQPTRKTGALSGAVLVHGSSRQTIAKAFVAVYLGDSLVAYTLATEDGMYRIANLDPGMYRVEVCRLGYSSSDASGIVINPNRLTFLDLTLDKTYEAQKSDDDEDFPIDSVGTFKIRHKPAKTVEAPGSIRGLVTLVNNDFPLEKVVVELYQDGNKVAAAQCNNTGSFSFGKLENGTYDVNIITDRNNNDMIPGVQVNTGRIKMVEVKLTRRGKIKSGR